jgi:hypothetical protein
MRIKMMRKMILVSFALGVLVAKSPVMAMDPYGMDGFEFPGAAGGCGASR